MRFMKACWMVFVLGGAPLLAGCVPVGQIQEESISDAGGFLDPQLRLAPDGESDYCAAEVLRFRYDELTETLRVADGRLLLSCCGQRSIRVERVDSLVEITERDDPDGNRCDAACAFDLAVTVPGVPSSPLSVRLLRDVTDAQGGPIMVWNGEVSLRGDPEAVVLDETPAPSCRDAHHEVLANPRPADPLTGATAEVQVR